MVWQARLSEILRVRCDSYVVCRRSRPRFDVVWFAVYPEDPCIFLLLRGGSIADVILAVSYSFPCLRPFTSRLACRGVNRKLRPQQTTTSRALTTALRYFEPVKEAMQVLGASKYAIEVSADLFCTRGGWCFIDSILPLDMLCEITSR